MTDDPVDGFEFDELVALALAQGADSGAAPRPLVKERLMARVTEPPTPEGFSFRFAGESDWLPHPVPGIRMKVLAQNPRTGYVMLLLDAAPGARFPAHHHAGAEECYVLSGSLYACNRRMTAGDFLHADADTDHGELWTDEGARVLLVVPPEDAMPDTPAAPDK